MNSQQNSIPNDQNTERQLHRLAAQRYLYSRAKSILIVQVVLTVPIAIGWAVLANLFPSLRLWASTYGIIISILDAGFLDTLQKSLKNRAAKIQELFDCDVLRLKWRNFTVGSLPDVEEIVEAAEKYYRKAPDLTDWYPPVVGEIPLALARIVCQRSNIRWDASLRRRYTAIILALFLAGVVGFLILGIALFRTITLENFLLTLLAPLSPALLWGIRECKKQRETAATLDRLKNHVENLWAKAISNEIPSEQLERESRDLQDEIYDQRRSNPMIFDWIYTRLRPGHEVQMTKAAQELVNEALRATE